MRSARWSAAAERAARRLALDGVVCSGARRRRRNSPDRLVCHMGVPNARTGLSSSAAREGTVWAIHAPFRLACAHGAAQTVVSTRGVTGESRHKLVHRCIRFINGHCRASWSRPEGTAIRHADRDSHGPWMDAGTESGHDGLGTFPPASVHSCRAVDRPEKCYHLVACVVSS